VSDDPRLEGLEPWQILVIEKSEAYATGDDESINDFCVRARRFNERYVLLGQIPLQGVTGVPSHYYYVASCKQCGAAVFYLDEEDDQHPLFLHTRDHAGLFGAFADPTFAGLFRP